MSKRIYNLIYAVYFMVVGADGEYENAQPNEYEGFAIEMLEHIQESLTKKETS